MSSFLLFDLDHTLWPFYTNLLSDKEFIDLLETFEFSGDIISIFKYIHEHKLPFGFVSRSKYYQRCSLLLQKLNVDLNNTPNVILWCTNKTKLPHVNQLIESEQINNNTNLILFDDDIENLNSVKKIVKKTVLVDKKLCLQYSQFINALNETN